VKLLLDSGVSRTAHRMLEEAGHEVESVRDWDVDPGDDEILARAFLAGQTVITIDKDFGQLAVYGGHPHVGIARLVELPVLLQASLCVKALDIHGQDLSRGAVVTVEASRIRIRFP